MTTTEDQTFSSAVARARASVKQVEKTDSREPQVSCSSMSELFKNYVLDGLSGKTLSARSRSSMGTLSDSCSHVWGTAGMVWHGEYWTRNLCEYPCGTVTERLPDGSVLSHRDAGVCLLSDVLETARQHPKYYLSRTACLGIVDRAERSGKSLPRPLGEVLMAYAVK